MSPMHSGCCRFTTPVSLHAATITFFFPAMKRFFNCNISLAKLYLYEINTQLQPTQKPGEPSQSAHLSVNPTSRKQSESKFFPFKHLEFRRSQKATRRGAREPEERKWSSFCCLQIACLLLINNPRRMEGWQDNLERYFLQSEHHPRAK